MSKKNGSYCPKQQLLLLRDWLGVKHQRNPLLYAMFQPRRTSLAPAADGSEPGSDWTRRRVFAFVVFYFIIHSFFYRSRLFFLSHFYTDFTYVKNMWVCVWGSINGRPINWPAVSEIWTCRFLDTTACKHCDQFSSKSIHMRHFMLKFNLSDVAANWDRTERCTFLPVSATHHWPWLLKFKVTLR